MIFIALAPTLQFKLIEEDPSDGLIFLPQGKINIFEKTKSITYAVNLSVLNELEGMIKKLEHDCYNEIRILEILRKRFSEIKNIKLRNNIGNSTHDILITSSPEDIYSLGKDLQHFYKKTSLGYCLTFRQKIVHFSNIFIEIDKLSRSDFTTLGKTINLLRLKKDVGNLLNNLDKGKYFFPFDFMDNFLHDFLSNTEFLLRFDETTMYLTFILPIFKQFNISAIFPKPIIINNSSYILKIEPKFLAQNGTSLILYNENEWYNRCYLFERQRFCLKPELEDICDEFINKHNNSDISLQCLNSVFNENTAIQVDTTIYFSIVRPTLIQLICDNGIFPFNITKSSKLEIGNCSTKTSFFEYDDCFGTIPFKLLRESNPLKNETKYDYIKYKSTILFIIFYLITIILIVTFTFVHNKRNRKDEISFYVSTQNVDYNNSIVTQV